MTPRLGRLRPCEICEHVLRATFDFLCVLQYKLAVDEDEQHAHAERGGLCELHTRQYAMLASAHGLCTGYPALLERQAGRIRVCLPHLPRLVASLDEPRVVEDLLLHEAALLERLAGRHAPLRHEK